MNSNGADRIAHILKRLKFLPNGLHTPPVGAQIGIAGARSRAKVNRAGFHINHEFDIVHEPQKTALGFIVQVAVLFGNELEPGNRLAGLLEPVTGFFQ